MLEIKLVRHMVSNNLSLFRISSSHLQFSFSHFQMTENCQNITEKCATIMVINKSYASSRHLTGRTACCQRRWGDWSHCHWSLPSCP